MKTTIVLIIILFASAVFAETINVPDDHQTIQGAINASEDGDTVLVAPGEYAESITFDGKAITVLGDPANPEEVVISGGAGSNVVFRNEEDEASILSGFTITDGNTEFGGGVYTNNSAPSLNNLIITNNRASERGGGIYCTNGSSASLSNSIVESNRANRGAGGIALFSSELTLTDVIITSNRATDGYGGSIACLTGSRLNGENLTVSYNSAATRGGGIYGSGESEIIVERGLFHNNSAEDNGGSIYLTSNATVALVNCTLSDNEADEGPCIYLGEETRVDILNCITWGNGEYTVTSETDSHVVVINYSDIEGGQDGINLPENVVQWGDGNINDDPLFVNSNEGDYRLRDNSPCIDTGDPDSPEDPDETRADMGWRYYHQHEPDEDGILNVPDEYASIQEAINRAQDSDTILVAPGEYVENINFEGKAIAIIGNPDDPNEVVIDGNRNGSVVTFNSEENEESVLSGFTIQNGRSGYGGGIQCAKETSPTLTDLIITNNLASILGGGIHCDTMSSPLLRRLEITNNESMQWGGGVGFTAAYPIMEHSVIKGNSAGSAGGLAGDAAVPTLSHVEIVNNTCFERAAVSILPNMDHDTPIFDHVTITGNITEEEDDAGGLEIWLDPLDGFDLTNSIIWGNGETEIKYRSIRDEGDQRVAAFTISYCDIGGGIGNIDWDEGGVDEIHAEGIIDEDPLFADVDGGDYHLTEDSPCIDTGDPESPEDPDETRTDMGAYYFHHINPDNDGVLNVPDEYETIQEAIDFAEDGDTVLVAHGEYVENINIDDKEIYIVGDPVHPGEVIIDGGDQGSVITIANIEDGNFSLVGFTIQNGAAEAGGGVFISRSNPNLHSLIIQNNVATDGGGGVYCTTESEPIIFDSVIRNNSVTDQRGLGGGGIAVWISTMLTVSVCEITDNVSASSGGGVMNWSEITLNNVLVSQNRSELTGGGFVNAPEHRITLNDVIVEGNSAGDYGGGALLASRSITNMNESVFRDNSTGNGGGALWLIEVDSFACSNTLFIGNEARVGAVLHSQNSNFVWLDHSTIVGNIASDGTILYTRFHGIDLTNSIVWANDGETFGVLDDGSFRVSYSAVDGIDELNGNIDEDPLFFDPDEGDYHLTEDSPCIDSGDPDSPEDPDGTRVDMGAYSFHQRDIEVNLDELVFEPIEEGQIDSLGFVISNVGNSDLTISCSILNNSPDFIIQNEDEEMIIESNSEFHQWVVFNPDGARLFEAVLMIQSNDPDEEEILIRLHGEAFSDVKDGHELIPTEFAITGLYPNPFNSSTSISYSLPQSQQVNMNLYDMSGRLIETLYDEFQSVGNHSVLWDSRDFGSGIYLMQLQTVTETKTAKLIVIK